MKKCPYCAEEIQDEAQKCKHCGEWLNGENRKSLLSASKIFLNKSGDFIKEQLEKQKKNRYKHLYYPTDEVPFELNGALFNSNKLVFNNSTHLYSELESVKYFAKVNRTNGMFSDTETELILYFLKGSLNLSRSSFMGIGAGKKTREKISFIQDYLKKKTFESRLNIYLQQILNYGYLNYPPNIKIYNNGDLEKKGKLVDNIHRANQDNRLDYGGIAFSSPLGRNQFYDPFGMYIWGSKDSSRNLLFSGHVVIELHYDKDIMDTIINKLITDKEIIPASTLHQNKITDNNN